MRCCREKLVQFKKSARSAINDPKHFKQLLLSQTTVYHIIYINISECYQRTILLYNDRMIYRESRLYLLRSLDSGVKVTDSGVKVTDSRVKVTDSLDSRIKVTGFRSQNTQYFYVSLLLHLVFYFHHVLLFLIVKISGGPFEGNLENSKCLNYDFILFVC